MSSSLKRLLQLSEWILQLASKKLFQNIMNIAPVLDADCCKLVYLEVIRRDYVQQWNTRGLHATSVGVACCQLVGHPLSTRSQSGEKSNRLLM